ncbi:hypothetical protein D2M30_1520 [Bacillus amyloliquefaciens]|nr:hypothetical protein D2M30_1520 [Bacillus amyloliquefaciens]
MSIVFLNFFQMTAKKAAYSSRFKVIRPVHINKSKADR